MTNIGYGAHEWQNLGALCADAARAEQQDAVVKDCQKLLTLLLRKYGRVEISDLDLAAAGLTAVHFYDALNRCHVVQLAQRR